MSDKQSLHFFEYDDDTATLKEWVWQDGMPTSRGALCAVLKGSATTMWFPWDIFHPREESMRLIRCVLELKVHDLDVEVVKIKSALADLTHEPESATMNASQPPTTEE